MVLKFGPFDATLVSQINNLPKRLAIEEGQWAEKRDATKEQRPA
jgi:hypothetical protein